MKKKIIEIISVGLLFTVLMLLFCAVNEFVICKDIVIGSTFSRAFGSKEIPIYPFFFTISIIAFSMAFLLITFIEFSLIKMFVAKNKQLTIISMVFFCLNPLLYSTNWYGINLVVIIVKIITIVFRVALLGYFIHSNKEIFINDKSKKPSKNI